MLLRHYKLNDWENQLLNMTDKQFDNYMVQTYPDMFKQRYAAKDQKYIMPMNFGFCIGPGWRHVLDELCKELKVIQDLTGFVCVFDQIKEKFGTARFYYHIEEQDSKVNESSKETWQQIISNLVHMYETYTAHVCEELGINFEKREKVSYPHWIYGMSRKGFEQFAVRTWGEEYGALRIDTANKCAIKQDLLFDIKDDLGSLQEDDLKKVKAFIEEVKNTKTDNQ